MTSAVWVTLRREGFHYWPDAPDELKHLRNPHRHLFLLRAEIRVHHDDRDVSFERLQALVDEAWPGPKLGARSCEQVAALMAGELAQVLQRPATVTVSEDGENGASVKFGWDGDAAV